MFRGPQMADPIRPNMPGMAQQSGATRTAGQRAFFEAASGRTGTASTVSNSPRAEVAPIQKIPVNLPADPPERILRPGSLLDIRV